jgi:tripartite-type tricarboxylate transporter receptor subunit TctC
MAKAPGKKAQRAIHRGYCLTTLYDNPNVVTSTPDREIEPSNIRIAVIERANRSSLAFTPRVIARTALACACVIPAAAVLGQNFPTKPVRIVADTAGGGTDFVARILARAMTDGLGQQVIVENRGGASGDIGIGFAAKAPPDGYTMLVWGNGMWTLPFLRSTSYDPVKDFAPITLAVSQPNVLVVHPSLPVKSVKELVALARARPGDLTFASGGPGTTSQIAAELFKAAVRVNMLDVPYKGAGPGVAALLGGEVQVMFPIASGIVQHIKSGRVRALAVTTPQPTPLFPELPTVAAAGLAGYQSVVLYGVFAPIKTPAALVARLHQESVRALNTPEVKDGYFRNATEVIAGTPEQLAAALKADMMRVGKVIKDAGIRVQ